MFVYLVVAMILIIILVILKSPQHKGKCEEDIVKNILEKIGGYQYIVKNIRINDNGKSRQIYHIAVT